MRCDISKKAATGTLEGSNRGQSRVELSPLASAKIACLIDIAGAGCLQYRILLVHCPLIQDAP